MLQQSLSACAFLIASNLPCIAQVAAPVGRRESAVRGAPYHCAFAAMSLLQRMKLLHTRDDDEPAGRPLAKAAGSDGCVRQQVVRTGRTLPAPPSDAWNSVPRPILQDPGLFDQGVVSGGTGG